MFAFIWNPLVLLALIGVVIEIHCYLLLLAFYEELNEADEAKEEVVEVGKWQQNVPVYSVQNNMQP